ncbi:MAG TPA: hypothetical protein VMB03_01320 [Bryobacteraceae bacterium]|nr:hypothetical protein [Bryobacteraceae bacterium]
MTSPARQGTSDSDFAHYSQDGNSKKPTLTGGLLASTPDGARMAARNLAERYFAARMA